MKKAYLASSFAYEDRAKTEQRKLVMSEASKYLESKHMAVYNPSTLKIPNAWDYSMWDWGDLVYQADKNEIDSCDLIVFLSYGKENNAGSVWEVGYAAAKGLPVIMVSMNPDSPESLMVIHSAYACVDGLNGLTMYDFDLMPRTRIERTES